MRFIQWSEAELLYTCNKFPDNYPKHNKNFCSFRYLQQINVNHRFWASITLILNLIILIKLFNILYLSIINFNENCKCDESYILNFKILLT